MLNIIQINSRPKIAKLFTASWRNRSLQRIGARRYTKCHSLNNIFEMRSIHWKQKAFVKPIWHPSCFFRIEKILSKTFIKRTISIVSIQKHKHASFPETYAQEITLVNSCCYILCISCQKSYPLDSVTMFPFMAEIFLIS